MSVGLQRHRNLLTFARWLDHVPRTSRALIRTSGAIYLFIVYFLNIAMNGHGHSDLLTVVWF